MATKKKMKPDPMLETIFSNINKEFGEGSIGFMNEQFAKTDIKTVSTGSFHLDKALGVGGLPKGRIVEIFGAESSGKTTLALTVIRESQKIGEICAFIDAEHALDRKWAETIGVDLERLAISQPNSGEEALKIAEELVRSNQIGVVVIDSVAALVPKKELEGEIGDSHVGLQARMMSQALRLLTSAIAKSDCVVIFINQTRMKIGVMYGNPETTSGGNALKFYASVRIKTRKGERIPKSGTPVIGQMIAMDVVKNKVGPPLVACLVPLLFGVGFSREDEVFDIAIEQNWITRSGTWFSYEGTNIGQGRENSVRWLKEHPEVLDKFLALADGGVHVPTEDHGTADVSG